jgi:type IV pilus assembly protein PilC
MSSAALKPYLCLASKHGGGRHVFIRSASNPSQLASAMRKERMTVQHAFALPSAFAPDNRLSAKDQAILNEQLYQLLSRGVPLVEALEVVAGTVTGAARPVVASIREQVASGVAFSEACAKAGAGGGTSSGGAGGGVFDAVTIAVYRAAERTGDLAGAARQLAQSMRRTLAVTSRAQALLIYPLVLLLVSLVVSFALLVFVLPQIGSQLLEMSEVQLPWYSSILFKVGAFLREHVLIVLGVIFVLVVLAVLVRAQIARIGLRFARRLPLLRDVLMASETARFFTVMSAMAKAGVPLAEGLSTANQVIGHPQLRKQLDTLRSKLVAGGLLRQLIEAVDALPLATRRLLLAAERAGNLDTAFAGLADDMTEEVERSSSRLLAFLNPILIVIMAVCVGGLLMAVLIPILTISGNLNMGS